MSRYVLRYKGEGAKPPEHVEKLRALPATRVLDDSSPRMTLVESDTALEELVSQLGALGLNQWVVRPDTSVPLPDTNFRPKRPP